MDTPRTPRRTPRFLLGASAFLVLVVAAIAVSRLRTAPTGPAVARVHEVRPVSAVERQAFVGSEACAPCHQELFERHKDSHHAHALTRVDAESHGERFRLPTHMRDPERELEYRTAVEGDRCVLVADYRGRTATVAADFGVGSGRHATTYLGAYGNELLELRLSYYSDAKRWHFSPGQQVKQISGGVLYPQGLVKARPVIEGCFTCHSTAVVKEGGRIMPEQSLLGVGCESCHGPGRAHVDAAKRGDRDLKMTRLGDIEGRLTLELCGQCHRSPVSEDPEEPFNKAQLPRLQGLALTRSPCFTNSGGKLSCLTCHDAHGDADRPRLTYNHNCRSCHSGSGGSLMEVRPCSLEPAGDCVSCHMPAQGVGMPTGLKYRTHWIKVWGVK